MCRQNGKLSHRVASANTLHDQLNDIATCCCVRIYAGEDAGRYVTARHGILGVVRRELSRLGVKYTVPLQQPNYVPLQQQAATPLQ
jgi:hypothetical protein